MTDESGRIGKRKVARFKTGESSPFLPATSTANASILSQAQHVAIGTVKPGDACSARRSPNSQWVFLSFSPAKRGKTTPAAANFSTELSISSTSHRSTAKGCACCSLTVVIRSMAAIGVEDQRKGRFVGYQALPGEGPVSPHKRRAFCRIAGGNKRNKLAAAEYRVIGHGGPPALICG